MPCHRTARPGLLPRAPKPSRPIERGIAGPGLLAHILVSKFADHQPLYRQSALYARDGVELVRSTMARWVGACGALMRPLRKATVMYAIEEQIRGQLPDQRKRIRQAHGRPLLDDFEVWLRTRLLTLSTQSDTTKAIDYMLNQWQAPVYYSEDGVAEIDNNIAENALRACCLGRKNFLFLGADSGGERGATMYLRIPVNVTADSGLS
jgi:hypothetical protein